MARRSGSNHRRRKYRATSSGREPLGQIFKKAKHVAEQKANIRRGRRSGMMARAAIAESSQGFDLNFPQLNWWQRFQSWAKALALLPFILVTVLTLVQSAHDEAFMHQFWRSQELLFFSIGVFLMLGWFWSRLFTDTFLLLYVLGHELTHALFVYLSFGRISDLKVSTSGGYILTNKSNLLIALSPYFIPFWSLVVLSISGFVVAIKPIPHGGDILLLLLGGTWCFHIVWTLWMIPRDQPDLQEHGRFYSAMIIILANLIILTGMACIASPDLELLDFAWKWFNNARDLVSTGISALQGFRL